MVKLEDSSFAKCISQNIGQVERRDFVQYKCTKCVVLTISRFIYIKHTTELKNNNFYNITRYFVTMAL